MAATWSSAESSGCVRSRHEAVTNVLRHARAQHIRVRLRAAHETLRLVIRDDGVGFDAGAVRARCRNGGALGLRGMEERVLLLDGRFEIESSAGAGTEVRVWLPLRPAMAVPDGAPRRP